ncbi:hypothetical protein MLD38_004626 [Melastoma candidum]|uniref:Uncharacterized protein n=1 Tax=Melastoma candidum TaxID=119954 RepID=A0ACB9SAZ0_9MYRT|nr:hypothetical protein MLD38_004626 [Melastoma candidum]
MGLDSKIAQVSERERCMCLGDGQQEVNVSRLEHLVVPDRRRARVDGQVVGRAEEVFLVPSTGDETPSPETLLMLFELTVHPDYADSGRLTGVVEPGVRFDLPSSRRRRRCA